MRSTLLVIGDLYLDDVKKAPSINKFIRYRKRLLRKKIQFELSSYDDVLLERLPKVFTKRLKIMLFFPYKYWNNNIEKYDGDDRVYGDHNFGRDFKKLFLGVEKILKNCYKDKDIEYVNPPRACILDRDKVATVRLLKKNGVSTPRIYNIENTAQLEGVLDSAGTIYIKPVFGSMGKGISVVTKKDCSTNFIFRAGRIASRPYDYNWKFLKVSKKRRKRFLDILIKKGFLFEEAVTLPVVKRRRFDIRAYVIYGRVHCLMARSVPKANPVTNWSQGGRIEPERFIKRAVPAKQLGRIKYMARKTARIAGLNYAGVDIVLDKDSDRIYVLEVHSFPGYARKFSPIKFLIDEIA